MGGWPSTMRTGDAGECPESLNPWQLVAGMEVAGDWSWAVLVSGSRSDVLHSGSRRLPPFSGVESENRINCHIRYRGDVSAPRIEPCPGDDIRQPGGLLSALLRGSLATGWPHLARAGYGFRLHYCV